MAEPINIFFAGGGTGGHLYPGLAVAQALRDVRPDARVTFLCTTREIDRTILESSGFEFVEQPIIPPRKSVGGLLSFFRSWRETKDLVRRLLRQRRPVAVLGLGGYAAGVAVKLTAQRRVPTAILNPDVVPGKANQYLSRHVRAICCQFEATRNYLPQSQREKVHVTGCPIRGDILKPPARAHAGARLGLNAALSTLVITGASQGALTVNEAALTALAGVNLQGWQVLHLSGKDHAAGVRQAYREAGIEAAVIDFTPAMANVWAVADLALSRAGASTCAELCACGVPSILMPYPFHRDMHQRANAKVLADAGGAILLDDEKDRAKNAPRLRLTLESLLYDATKRASMSVAARALAKPDAAQRVALVLTEMIEVHR